jgi:hypothetical protein
MPGRQRRFAEDPDGLVKKRMNSMDALRVLAGGCGLTDARHRATDRAPGIAIGTRGTHRHARRPIHCFGEQQSRFVFRVAYSILRDIQDSDDVVQETFLKL